MIETLLALAEEQKKTDGWLWQDVFLPPQSSTLAPDIDAAFLFITYLSTFFFVLIVGAMTYFVITYRRRSPDQKTSPNEGNLRLEIVWSAVPAVLLVVIFVWGFKGFLDSRTPPADSLNVRVTASKWAWLYEYPNGVQSGELVVPVGRPVKLTMASMDVLHSFFVADFRVKQDVLPNRYTVVWFNATDPGEYWVQCTEYCGDGHSVMRSKVIAMAPDDYQAWVDAGGPLGDPTLTPVEKGEIVFKLMGCTTCHSVAGDTLVGPPLDGLFGRTEQTNVGPVVVDDNYIRESILEPNAKIVQGFDPKMPTYKGRIKDDQLGWLIDYMKSIGQ